MPPIHKYSYTSIHKCINKTEKKRKKKKEKKKLKGQTGKKLTASSDLTNFSSTRPLP